MAVLIFRVTTQYGDQSTVCTASDPTSFIQGLLNQAGSVSAPPLGPNTESSIVLASSVPGNTGQGTVMFPAGATITISSTLSVPPGVTLDLNGSTLIQSTANQSAVKVVFDNTQTTYYTASKNCVRNGVLQGQGWNVSTTYGLWIDGICNCSGFDKLVIWGFKYAIKYMGGYNAFGSVDCSGNAIGLYVSLSNTGTAGQAIDTSFTRCRFSRNAIAGIWIENGQNLSFFKCDFDQNGKWDIIVGEFPGRYLSGITITNGGSGYPEGATLPMTLTDSGGGKMMSAIAVTNSSGVVTQAFVTEGGLAVTSAVAATLSASTGSGATFTTQTTDDSSTYGDFIGANDASAFGLFFHGCKMENAGNAPGVSAHGARPDSGYAIRLGTASNNCYFYNTTVAAEADSNNVPMYQFRWAYVNGGQHHFIFPQTPGLSSNNPAGDRGLFRVNTSGSLFIHWPHQTPVSNAFGAAIDQNGSNDLYGQVTHMLTNGATTYMQNLALTNASGASSATAGSASALPSAPQLYLYLSVDGTTYKLPLYNP